MTRPRDFNDILSRLTNVKCNGSKATADCPLPGHKTPAGHLTLKDGGDKALVTCQGGKHGYSDYCEAWGYDSLTYSRNGNGPEDNVQCNTQACIDDSLTLSPGGPMPVGHILDSIEGMFITGGNFQLTEVWADDFYVECAGACIPEPASLGLVGLGCLLLVRRRLA